jgi:hypothetical protein
MKKTTVLCLVLGIVLASSAAWAASITVNVTPGSNATSHRIEKKIGAGAYTSLITLAMPTVQYEDATVSAGNNYCYRSVSIGTLGESVPSAECCHALFLVGPSTVSCSVNP